MISPLDGALLGPYASPAEVGPAVVGDPVAGVSHNGGWDPQRESSTQYGSRVTGSTLELLVLATHRVPLGRELWRAG